MKGVIGLIFLAIFIAYALVKIVLTALSRIGEAALTGKEVDFSGMLTSNRAQRMHASLLIMRKYMAARELPIAFETSNAKHRSSLGYAFAWSALTWCDVTHSEAEIRIKSMLVRAIPSDSDLYVFGGYLAGASNAEFLWGAELAYEDYSKEMEAL